MGEINNREADSRAGQRAALLIARAAFRREMPGSIDDGKHES